MKDPGFVKAYEEVQPEVDIIREHVDAGTSQNIILKESSEKAVQ